MIRSFSGSESCEAETISVTLPELTSKVVNCGNTSLISAEADVTLIALNAFVSNLAFAATASKVTFIKSVPAPPQGEIGCDVPRH